MSGGAAERFDLIVIGAGPAGGEAALAAASCGLAVVVADEGPAPGGQVWRAPRTGRARAADPGDPDRRRGDALRARLAEAPLTLLPDAQVWAAAPGFEVSVASPGGARLLSAPRLLVAAGAQERVLPFPGWTTPGVFGLAAATALIKAEGALPGTRIVVAGQGPLLIAVAAKAIALGLKPVAIVDRAGRADWARALPGFLRSWPMLAQGAKWMARIAAAGVPVLRRHEIAAARGGERLAELTVRSLDTGAETALAADTLYVGNGLAPGDELFRLLGAAQDPSPLRGGHAVRTDGEGRSSVPGLYAAGDGAGVRGAAPAAAAGEIAGLAAAVDAGALSAAGFRTRARAPRRRAARLAAFADASCRLMRLEDREVAAIPAETVLCRCEDVTASEVRAAIADGAHDINQLKHFTRLGMGPCQGRMCGLNAAAILRETLGAEAGALRLTPRAPLRPIETAQLIGEFSYADIPVPKPAPL